MLQRLLSGSATAGGGFVIRSGADQGDPTVDPLGEALVRQRVLEGIHQCVARAQQIGPDAAVGVLSIDRQILGIVARSRARG